MEGKLLAIYTCSRRGDPMHQHKEVEAIKNRGLAGDRYCQSEGSFSTNGNRQVTLINASAFHGGNYLWDECRRNLIVNNFELLETTTSGGKLFDIGEVMLRGIAYCGPCNRPDKLSGRKGFREQFMDKACIYAEVVRGGIIRQGDVVRMHKVR